MVLLGLLLMLSFFATNASVNLTKTSTTLDFDFIWSQASFELGEGVTGFAAGDTVLAALYAGIANTIMVSLASIVVATVLGIVVGILRISTNPMARWMSSGYIEIMRNIPLILQMLFWYAVITRSLPTPRRALSPVAGVYITNRGLYFPSFQPASGAYWLLVGLAAVLLILAVRAAGSTAGPRRGWRALLGGPRVLALTALATLAVVGFSGAIELPELSGLNFTGGSLISPEFSAVFLGLSIYSAAFIAENVRSGIMGVSFGQKEAAASLGLRPGQTMRLVILPQALKISIPPIASQYLDIVKNSSLAVAIGYPEIMRVATVVISEFGRSIEVITLVMVIYLTMSLTISGLTNAYNNANIARER